MKITDWIDQKWLGWRGGVVLVVAAGSLYGLSELVQYIFSIAF